MLHITDDNHAPAVPGDFIYYTREGQLYRVAGGYGNRLVFPLVRIADNMTPQQAAAHVEAVEAQCHPKAR